MDISRAGYGRTRWFLLATFFVLLVAVPLVLGAYPTNLDREALRRVRQDGWVRPREEPRTDDPRLLDTDASKQPKLPKRSITLDVLVVSHSHTDAGWIMTYQKYFYERVHSLVFQCHLFHYSQKATPCSSPSQFLSLLFHFFLFPAPHTPFLLLLLRD